MSGMMVMMLMAMKMIMMLVETAMIGCWWWWHDGDDDENDEDDEDDDDDAVCEKCIGLESCGGVQVTDHSLGRVLATYKYLHKYTLLTNIYQWCTNIYTNMHCLQWCRMRSVGKSWPKACTAPWALTPRNLTVTSRTIVLQLWWWSSLLMIALRELHSSTF